MHKYPPTLSASSVLDILCHPSSTYHQSKAARPYIDISPKHGSKMAAREPGSKAGKPEKAGKAGKASKAGKAGKAGKASKGSKGSKGTQGSKAARQQASKAANPWI